MSFPPSEIAALLEVSDDILYNMGESTSLSYHVKDLCDSPQELTESIMNLHLDYGSIRGNRELCETIAQDANVELSSWPTAGPVTGEDVVVTIGAVSSLFLVSFLQCSAQRGDECIVASPNFPASIDGLQALQVPIHFLHQRFADGYRVDLEAFEQLLHAGITLVSVTSPGNPSGVLIDHDTLLKMVALMEKKAPKAYLVVDETYREARIHDSDCIGPSAACLSPKIIALSSLSKAVGTPGIRIGWLICRDRELVQRVITAKMNILICCPTVEEFLALQVFRHKDRLLAEQQAHLSRAYQRLQEWVNEHSEYVRWVSPDRGALCCVQLREERFPDAEAIERFHRVAREEKVLLAKGSWFRESDASFRVGFGALPYEQFSKGLDAISRALHQASN